MINHYLNSINDFFHFLNICCPLLKIITGKCSECLIFNGHTNLTQLIQNYRNFISPIKFDIFNIPNQYLIHKSLPNTINNHSNPNDMLLLLPILRWRRIDIIQLITNGNSIAKRDNKANDQVNLLCNYKSFNCFSFFVPLD